jgi:hypothetical protein
MTGPVLARQAAGPVAQRWTDGIGPFFMIF